MRKALDWCKECSILLPSGTQTARLKGQNSARQRIIEHNQLIYLAPNNYPPLRRDLSSNLRPQAPQAPRNVDFAERVRRPRKHPAANMLVACSSQDPAGILGVRPRRHLTTARFNQTWTTLQISSEPYTLNSRWASLSRRSECSKPIGIRSYKPACPQGRNLARPLYDSNSQG
jgi:hypothetical protein